MRPDKAIIFFFTLYAAASRDMGHEAGVTDVRWALGRPQKIADFGYRAVRRGH